ncbi:hypothetical protein NL676_030464 [Syzygium grande]|nr:hypothetical protein NL676_030464 [Syzygium grande]
MDKPAWYQPPPPLAQYPPRAGYLPAGYPWAGYLPASYPSPGRIRVRSPTTSWISAIGILASPDRIPLRSPTAGTPDERRQ